MRACLYLSFNVRSTFLCRPVLVTLRSTSILTTLLSAGDVTESGIGEGQGEFFHVNAVGNASLVKALLGGGRTTGHILRDRAREGEEGEGNEGKGGGGGREGNATEVSVRGCGYLLLDQR